MKYLYVLTSCDSDYYFEQALLSITSLRLQMPDAFISLLVDDSTEPNLTGKHGEILNLINELKSVNIDKRFNIKARSRWLKTSMRRHIEGDFLFIDCDTVIADDLSEIDSLNINLGAVLDQHICLSILSNYSPVTFKKRQIFDKKLGFLSTINSDLFFNSGVILCRDNASTHDFFKEWHRLWLYCFEKKSIKDQHSFNQANYNLANVITELPGNWNCQIVMDGSIKYLHDARIIHYFANMYAKEENPFILANRVIFEKIKYTGNVDKNIINMLKNPKSHFASNTRLVLIKEFEKSVTYSVIKKIFYSKIGIIIENIFSFVHIIIFKPIRKLFSKKELA